MDKNTISINITLGTLFKTAVVVLGVFLAYQLRGLLLVLLTAAVIASVIEPGTKWFVKNKIPRAAAVILMYVLILAILAGIFSFVLPPLFSEIVAASSSLPKSIKTIDLVRPFNSGALSGFKVFFPDIPSTVSVGDVAGIFAGTFSSISGGVFDTVSSFFGGIISFILVIVISFYLAVREDGIGEFLGIITPIQYEPYVRGLWRRSEAKIGKWMQGQLFLAALVGVMVYFALLLAGVKHPLLLAFLAGIFELIPIVGMTLSAIPAFLLATIDGGFGLGLIVIAIYIFIQQIEAHIIYPLVVKKIIGVSPLLVIIALVAGAELAGLVGAVLAIPISVALQEYLDDIEKKKHIVVE